MADSAVAITAGSGTNIDSRTEGTNQNHRQVLVLGDPATNAGVAGVDVTNGLEVQIIPEVPAGANMIGSTVGDLAITTHTLSCLAGALDQDDVLADTEVISGLFRANDKGGNLVSMTLLDGDDFGDDLIVYFLSSSASMGTEGAAVDISDANAENILGSVNVATADYTDLILSQIATKADINLRLVPASGTDDLYVAVVGGVSNTNTYTAGGIVLRLAIQNF